MRLAKAHTGVGGILYFTGRSGNLWFNGSGFEAYNDDHWASYAMPATSVGAGWYSFGFPDLVDSFDFRLAASSSAAPADDIVESGDFDDLPSIVANAPLLPSGATDSIISSLASGVTKTDVDGTLTVKHTLSELMAMDGYLRKRALADANAALGVQYVPFRLLKNVPPGANGV